MRMLAEMAVASPDTGSFSTYADRAIGHWAGFTIGSIWVFTLVITLLLTVTNLFSVKNYGEFEFWFALIKVVAIIGFVVLGLLAIFGLLPTLFPYTTLFRSSVCCRPARSAACRTWSIPSASCRTAWARCWQPF